MSPVASRKLSAVASSRSAPHTTLSARSFGVTQLRPGREAVAIVRQGVAEGWRQAVVDRLSADLGAGLWHDLDRHWRATRCRKLAELARSMESAQQDFHRLTVPGIAATSGLTIGQSRAISQLTVEIMNPLPMRLADAVMLIRLVGIVMCSAHRRIRSCRCLRDLADANGPQALDRVLRQSLGQAFGAS